MNSTNKTTSTENDENLLQNIYIALYTLSSIFILLGTFLNVWLLCAIVTSADLRVHMRNKLIVSTSVLHLTESVIKIPMFFAMINVAHRNCYMYSSYANMDLIQDFIANWILVEMIIIYVCQTMDLKISESLTVLGQRSVTISVLLLPWAVSLITVPAMVSSDYWNEYGCFIPKSYEIFKSIDFVVPILLSIILLAVAIVKKRNRYRKGFSASNMQVDLISRGPELDETSPLVVGVAVSLFCDAGTIVQVFGLVNNENMFSFIVYLLENSRVVFMVLPWLLFNDIRTRMKTWRPWYRPSPGIDLTITYGKGQDEQ